MNLTYANENFIITTVNKFPISKIDVINKPKYYSTLQKELLTVIDLDKYYNQAIKDLINERVVSEGLKMK